MINLYLATISSVFVAIIFRKIFKKIFPDAKSLDNLPGPWGVPFLGYLPFMDMRVHLTLTKLWSSYGDVYKLRIGSRDLVILNGNDTIRRALAEKSIDFAGRPDFYTYEVASKDTLLGINDYSEKYRIAKKVLVKSFGCFNNEKQPELQQVAHKAVGQLMEIVKRAQNSPFDPNPHMYPIVCIIMGYVCWGEFFDIEDERVKHILGNAHEFGTAMAFGVACDYFPGMKWFFREKLQKLETLMAANRDYSCKLANQHVETYDGQEMRDITDFFHKAAEEMDEEKRNKLNLKKQDLLSIPGGMFGAGFATIAITVKWSIILLAKHPDFQTKMQEELDRIIGKDRLPDFQDLEHLPYTTAVIAEVYRYSSIAHIAFAHKTLVDTEINGFFLPEGTTVVANFYSAHRDPKYFQEPYKFNPDRFFNSSTTGSSSDETSSPNNLNRSLLEKVVPYGLGMRRCAGEVVARLEIYVFIASLFLKCRVEESPDWPLDLDDYKATLALDPNPFRAIFRSRLGEW